MEQLNKTNVYHCVQRGLLNRYVFEKKGTKFLDSYQVRIINMPWRDQTNTSDCGIYLMKHMETYRGQLLKNWNVGFKPNEVIYYVCHHVADCPQ